jgi:tRNA (guanine-N7-)-methyltransferase
MGRLRRKPGVAEALGQIPELVVVTNENCCVNETWKQRFSVSGPLFLELGTGKGRFLQEMARQHPESCFVGLEKEPGVLIQAVRKTRELELTNLKFILGDVQWLDRMFAPAEVDGIYIHFCDPWPKSRHEKRRLTHPDFLRRYRQILGSTGTLRFKTDNPELFEYSLASFVASGMELLHVSRNLHAEGANLSFVMTEYEMKFYAAGLPIHYCEARFVDSEEAPTDA